MDSEAWKTQCHDLIRSLSGAFLFGIPFLYAIEMWWIASYLEHWKLLVFFVLIAGINMVLGYIIYLEEETPWHIAAGEAVYNIAIGLVSATLVLCLLGRFKTGDPGRETVAKIILQAIPLSVGAAVTHRIERRSQGGQGTDVSKIEPSGWRFVLTQIGITLAGGLFLGMPLSSTGEIQVLAIGTTSWHILGLIAFSIGVTYLFNYRNVLALRIRGAPDKVLPPLSDALMNYTVALITSTITLYLFDRIEFENPPLHIANQIILLSLPTTVGGAAGRRIL